jgi:hypothetical protein
MSTDRLDPEIFQIGEVEVRLYQDRDKMARELPPFFGLLEATRVANQQIRVRGFYDPQNKRIYSIDDARVVIHEFKHYLEPGWRHEPQTPQMEIRPPKMAQAKIDPVSSPALMLAADPNSDLSSEWDGVKSADDTNAH